MTPGREIFVAMGLWGLVAVWLGLFQRHVDDDGGSGKGKSGMDTLVAARRDLHVKAAVNITPPSNNTNTV